MPRAVPTCLAVALFGTIASSSSAAPTGDHARAEGHFSAARKHVKDGRCDLAIPELRSSVAFEPSVGAYLNLGDCANRQGDVAEAFHSYKRAEELALARNDDRLREIRNDSAALGARVVRVVFRSETAAVTVLVDGKPIPPESASDLVVTPDVRHEIVLRAPGKAPFIEQVSGHAGQVVYVTATFTDAPPPVETPPLAATTTPHDSQPPIAEPSPIRTAAYVVLGLGGATLVTGAVFGILALGSKGDLADAVDSDPSCRGAYPDGSCSADAKSRLDPIESRASSQATLATVFVGAGVAGLATGAILYAVSGDRTARTSWKVSPTVGRSGAGVLWGGSF